MKPFNRLNENIISDIDISPPKIRKKSGGDGDYVYYAIFEEMYIPKSLITLISPYDEYSGSKLFKEIKKKNPYKVGVYDFIVFPVYVNTIKNNDVRYDKITFHNHLKTPTSVTEESVINIHNDLIIKILDKHNTEEIDIESQLKFKYFSLTRMNIDDDWWENMIENMKDFL